MLQELLSAGLDTNNIPTVELPVLQNVLNYDTPGLIRGTFKKPNETYSYEQILMVNTVIRESLNVTTQLPADVVQREIDSQNSVRNIFVSNDIRHYDESESDEGPETETSTTKRKRSGVLDTSSGVVMSKAKCDQLELLKSASIKEKEVKENNKLTKSIDLAARINQLTNKKYQLIAQYYNKPYNVLLGELKLIKNVGELHDIYQSLAISNDGKIKKSNLTRGLLEEEICKIYYVNIRKELNYKNDAVESSSSQQNLTSLPRQRQVVSSHDNNTSLVKESVSLPLVLGHQRSINNSHGTRSLFTKNK